MTLLFLVIVATLAALGVPALAVRRDGALATRRVLFAIGGGVVVLAVLAYVVRTTKELGVDVSVARWARRETPPAGVDALDAVTHLGEPTVAAVLAALLALVETVRTRSRWVIPFVAVVVAGNGALTTSIKHLADRVRPDVNPVAETLGPSFPSGHSSWSVALWAAAALLLCRGRGHGARVAIVAVSTAMAVIVAGSRVLLAVHWLTDVIAGVALGLAWFCLCALAFARLLLGARDLPADAPPRSGPSLGVRPSRSGAR